MVLLCCPTCVPVRRVAPLKAEKLREKNAGKSLEP